MATPAMFAQQRDTFPGGFGSTSLPGLRKAAILMVALGPEACAKIFKNMREDEIENITLEVARRRLTSYARVVGTQRAIPMRWLAVTLFLGLLFVAGQYAAWLQLKSQGLYLATNTNSSFFYLFTGVHAAHVLGGLLGLVYIMSKLHRSVLRRSTFSACAQYWHFMDVLWIYLLLLLWTKI